MAVFRALLVHLFTASSLLWGTLAVFAVLEESYRQACLWLMLALAVDSSDGFLARRYQVARVLPAIDGRKLDDIVDYLVYTFIPVFMLGHAGWLPEPRAAWVSLPLIASAFAFSNRSAKEEAQGFFVGFPSYWNVFAIYVVLWLHEHPAAVAGLTLLLSVSSVLPLRFVYPSHARRWRGLFVAGALLWLAALTLLLVAHPADALWVQLTLLYPALYTGLSFYLKASQ